LDFLEIFSEFVKLINAAR